MATLFGLELDIILGVATLARYLAADWIVMPAIAMGATATGMAADITLIKETTQHDSNGFSHKIGHGIHEGWEAFKDVFDKRDAMPDLSGANAAIWFYNTGMTAEELEIPGGMQIRPHFDASKTDRAMFAKGDIAVEGSFMGRDARHLDGIRTGNFSAFYPGFGDALEGQWIVVNRREASRETATRFDNLRSTLGNEKDSKVLFEDLLEHATANQAASM